MAGADMISEKGEKVEEEGAILVALLKVLYGMTPDQVTLMFSVPFESASRFGQRQTSCYLKLA